jgi:hypothetical protein
VARIARGGSKERRHVHHDRGRCGVWTLVGQRGLCVALARSADPDALSRHHLEQRERPRMGQRRVQLGRHGDDAHADRSEIRRPLERIFERWPLDQRVPFDQDELGIEPVLAALCDEAVDEMLHPALQIAAVVVIARPSKHLK